MHATGDRMGRTPLVLGKKADAHCASFESFAYLNLGYTDDRELGPEKSFLSRPEHVEVKSRRRKKWKYARFFGPIMVIRLPPMRGLMEEMRYKCGKLLAKDDNVEVDYVAGVRFRIAHAIGYANQSGYPFARPFIKYTPTCTLKFYAAKPIDANLVAHMKRKLIR